jgi:tRNA(adenine34) deaminase
MAARLHDKKQTGHTDADWQQSHERKDTPMSASKKKPPSEPKKWSANVKTTSTYPPRGLFTKSAWEIARILATKKVSPKGPASGLRMLSFYINRAGKTLTTARRKELEKAKLMMSERIHNSEKHPTAA